MRPSRLRDSLPEHAAPGGVALDSWPTLLVIDDDQEMLRTLVCYFEKRGFHVAAGSSIAEAKTFFHRRKTWTLVMADYHLPDGNGWELCCWVREQPGTPPPFLLMSGSAYGEALSTGVDFLQKPFAIAELEERVRAMLRRPAT
jgi:two-component system, OmpR family, response regulator RegX3